MCIRDSPNTWTKYTFTVSGVGSTPVPVKFAFRYYVTNGGPSGANSDIIGVDTFSVDRPIAAVSNANANKKVSVYPNPTSDYLKFTSQEKVKSVSVFDASGKNVTVNLSNNEVDVRNLAKGVYTVSYTHLDVYKRQTLRRCGSKSNSCFEQNDCEIN